MCSCWSIFLHITLTIVCVISYKYHIVHIHNHILITCHLCWCFFFTCNLLQHYLRDSTEVNWHERVGNIFQRFVYYLMLIKTNNLCANLQIICTPCFCRIIFFTVKNNQKSKSFAWLFTQSRLRIAPTFGFLTSVECL
jgi:uncharacterized membrane protein YozB (DUF420 family)